MKDCDNCTKMTKFDGESTINCAKPEKGVVGGEISPSAKHRPRRGRRGAERTTTGGRPQTPDWMASGRRVKCAAGEGGEDDRIGGERVDSSESNDCGRGAQSNDSTTLTSPLDPWKLFEVLSRQAGEGKAERGLGRANWHKRSDRFCQSRQGGWARAETGLVPFAFSAQILSPRWTVPVLSGFGVLPTVGPRQHPAQFPCRQLALVDVVGKDARELRFGEVAEKLVVVHANDDEVVGDFQSGFSCGVEHVRGPQIVDGMTAVGFGSRFSQSVRASMLVAEAATVRTCQPVSAPVAGCAGTPSPLGKSGWVQLRFWWKMSSWRSMISVSK